MIGNEINCLKKVGRFQLKEANTQCQSFNASQILSRSREESENLFSALLSLDLDSETGNTLVSIGIYKTQEEEWSEFTGQLISFFNWAPNEPDNYGGNENYAGLSVNEINRTIHWADYNGTVEINVVCTKRSGQGKYGSKFEPRTVGGVGIVPTFLSNRVKLIDQPLCKPFNFSRN